MWPSAPGRKKEQRHRPQQWKTQGQVVQPEEHLAEPGTGAQAASEVGGPTRGHEERVPPAFLNQGWELFFCQESSGYL